MPTNKHSPAPLLRNAFAMTFLGILCVVASFSVGMKTAGDVSTIGAINANETTIAGDINLDGVLNTEDAIVILEIVRGYSEATPAQLQRDPNRDGHLTIDDAIRVLHDSQAL